MEFNTHFITKDINERNALIESIYRNRKDIGGEAPYAYRDKDKSGDYHVFYNKED